MINYTASAEGPISLAKCFQHATDFIRFSVQNRDYYTVGITSNPELRRIQEDGGYERYMHRFNKVTILYVAELSGPHIPDSSGSMKIARSDIFNPATHPMRINRKGDGGDFPPGGSPQFLYVVWSHLT